MKSANVALGFLLLALVLTGCIDRAVSKQPVDSAPTQQKQTLSLTDWKWTFECNGALMDARPGEIDKSTLNFSVGYLPRGFSLRGEIGAACQGRVRSLLRLYTESNSSITIVRYAGRPGNIPAAGDLRVGDKLAVRNGAQLLLIEEFGVTTIEGSTDFSELLKVAEGIHNTTPTLEQRQLMDASIAAHVITEYFTALSEKQVPQAVQLLTVRYRYELGNEKALKDNLQHIKHMTLARSEPDEGRPHPAGTIQFRIELALDLDGADPAWAAGTNVRWVVLAWDDRKKEGKSWAIDSIAT